MFCLQQFASKLDSQLNGIVAIVDLQNVSVNQVRHFTPIYAKKIADLLTVRNSSYSLLAIFYFVQFEQGAFPLSIQVIHIVNQNWMVSMLMSIIWPFLSTKLQQRVKQTLNALTKNSLY